MIYFYKMTNLITFNEEFFRYPHDILINDIKEKKTYKISFSKSIPKKLINSTVSLLSNDKVEESWIKECQRKENGKDIEIHFKNVYIPKILTVQELIYMLSFLLNISQEYLILNDIYAYDLNKGFVCVKDFFNEDNKFSEMYEYSASHSINNIPLTFIVNNSNSGIATTLNIFWQNYIKVINYVQKILDLNNNTKLNLSLSIKNINIMVIYEQNINIVKLFNVLHVNDTIKKINIHDEIIDQYKRNDTTMQYCKCYNDEKYPFKSTKSVFNTININLNYKISEGVYLNSVNVSKFGFLECSYSIINNNLTYDDIIKIIQKFMKRDGEFSNIINLLNISECINVLEFNINNYKYYISSITANSNVKFQNRFNIDVFSKILNTNIPSLRYLTKTSLSLTGFQTFNISTFENYNHLINTHDTVSLITIQKNNMGNIIITKLNKYEININTIESCNLDNLLLNTALLAGVVEIDNTKKNNENNKLVGIDGIRKRCKEIPTKQLLKVLEEIDPLLFGPRYIKGKIRPYSGLAQKENQRVYPITEEEYEIIKKKNPESVVNIKNQTSGDRLCLFCPYENSPFLNFHFSPGEKCVPKCTIGKSNKSQYMNCSQQLESIDMIKFDTIYENQTITLYNPLISKGRKCYPPEEFSEFLNQFYLVKLNTNLGIWPYFRKTYGEIQPFVLKRNVIDKTYQILTDYDPNTDYILVFQSEITETEYFITLNEQGPLLFSKNTEIKNFFAEMTNITDSHKEFINFISEFLTDETFNYENKTIQATVKHLSTFYNMTYVFKEDTIVGIIYNNIYYSTPPLKLFHIEEGLFTRKYRDVLEEIFIKKSINLPQYDDFETRFITGQYKDYTDNLVYIIEYKDSVKLFVEKTKHYDLTKPTYLFDKDTYIEMQLFNKTKTKYNSNIKIEELIYYYLYIYLSEVKEFKKDEFRNVLKNMKILVPETTNIKYVDRDILSFRKSVINDRRFDNILDDINLDELHSYIYDISIRNLEFNNNENEKIVSKKITASQ